MKVKIIIPLLFSFYLQGQSYEKEWKNVYKKIEEGAPFSIQETLDFIARHKKKLGDYPDNTVQLYSYLGNSYYSEANYEKAKEAYLESYKYALVTKDTTFKHIVALSLAIVNQTTNDFLESEKYYLKCMYGMAAIYGQSSREYTQIFYDYTRLLIDLEKYSEAKAYVEALLYYYKTLDGEKNVKYISLLNCKAIILQNSGNYNEAVEIYKNIVESNSLLQLGDTLGHIITISNLGDVYREAGQYSEGLEQLKQASELHRRFKLRDKETLATIENNMALCYKNISEMKLAENAYNNAIAIYDQIGGIQSEGYCSTLSNKADLLRLLGRHGEASELLWKAIEIRKQRYGTNTENYANALSNLANVYFEAGYIKEALEKNLEAKDIYRQVVGEKHQSYGNCINNLSLCYLHLHDYKNAEDYKLKALSIIEASVGKNNYRYPAYLISTYGIYRKTKQLDKAEKYIREALQVVSETFGKTHELYAHGTLALAEIYTLNQKFEEAGPLYFKSLDYYSAQINDYFDAMSEEDQMSFLGTISSAFESFNIYVINYKLNHLGKELPEHLQRVLKYQLQLKSLLANRSARIRKEVASSKDENLRKTYSEWIALKTGLLNIYKTAGSADQNNNELVKQISVLEAQLRQQLKSFSKQTIPNTSEIAKNLGPDEAAIEIFKVNEALNDTQGVTRYGALVIRKNKTLPDLVIFKEGNVMDGEQFTRYYNAIDGQTKDSLSYGVYFKKLEPSLKGVKRLYLSADGVFHKVNLLSLYDPAAKKYLFDQMDVVYTSNLASVGNVSTTGTASKNAVLFGYPDYEYDFRTQKASEIKTTSLAVAKRYGLVNLPGLPGTKTEVEEISKELGTYGWKAEVYMESGASEDNLRKIKSPGILHIATHGFYLKDIESDDQLFLGFESRTFKNKPLLRSGLILAGAGPSTQDETLTNSENDGILTAYEASLLDLDGTGLVVLSACQTGLGDEIGTEGVAGLQRSLAIAGARHLIMSLWPVDDDATRMLMTEFYRSYGKSQDVGLALKQAQAEVKKKYPDPVFWAAFVHLKTFN